MHTSIEPLQQAGSAVITASVKLICPKGDRALVLRKADGRWDLPGGKPEIGEGLETALVRETIEELGLSLPYVERVGQWLNVRPGRTPRLVTFFRLAGEARFDLSDIRLSEEHIDALWAARDVVAGLDMPSGFRDAISSVLTGRC